MFNIGWTEVVIVLGVALVIFGPKKIPELGAALGKTLRGFKDEMAEAPEDEPDLLDEDRD
ncbi:twin-arginine translocase TatA/TatE family subunit [Leptolyngbya sp. PCC 6406]|uniref:Sec-independent protein translocase subunit TatA/TatB n=1 Tax=Leptolyngbya sp. PCC 6406 TaxID=1173264 RepID=UPI0002AC2DF5|nr:twin-arginine translocase TatA/TatE family subunit [Leptolyngbya sp. PCC 6406]